jgi:integrase/recombinase XerD
MDTALIPTSLDVPSAPVRGFRNPVRAYLSRLAPGASQRSMAQAIEAVARVARAIATNEPLDLPPRYSTDPGSDLKRLEMACPLALAIPWQGTRAHNVAAIRARLASTFSLCNANRMLAALRGVIRAAWECELIDAETRERVLAAAKNIRGETKPKGRHLEAGELRTLFQVCCADEADAGRRDAALLAVLYGAGLRRSEAVNLTLADLDSQTGALTVREGKGRKDRTTYVANGALNALHDWLSVRGDTAGPLFCPITRGGRIILRHLTTQAVFGALRKRAREAGIAGFSPHDLRRTFAGDMLEAGADISHVQHLMGHANPTTTSRYDRRPEHARRRAAGLLHVPYKSNS